MNDTISRTVAIEVINSILNLDPPNSEFGKGCRAGLRKARDILGWEEVEAHTKNLSQIAHCDEFICEKCGIHLKGWVRVKTEEYEDGYNDNALYEYEFEYCPNCGYKTEEAKQ